MKKGSALLIVLGMLAFMVISAVAFSAYMRYSRLPSSYLRRSSSSRLLVKAGLAEAIDQIDAAIGDNLHPNVGRRQPRSGVGGVSSDVNGVQNENLNNRNVWAHRIYLGTNSVSNLMDPDDTVSTLSLEGLAYIPPPLVNYARYYSRRSRAATWHTLGFDSGRYAFCAIDVSDYLDVNTLSANFGRGSSPATRLSLAHVFENLSGASPSAWDTFIRRFWKTTAAEAAIANAGNSTQVSDSQRMESSLVPLISVADLNLAMRANASCGLSSPFCDYILNNRKMFYNGAMYSLQASAGDEGDKIHRMTFVTDSYFPGTGGSDTYDLTLEANQPFTRSLLERAGIAYGSVTDNGSPVSNRLKERISALGLVMLYDYLDDDNVPVSLSIPSCERVPMIAAIKPDFSSAQVKFTPGGPTYYYNGSQQQSEPGVAAATDPATVLVDEITTYKLDAQSFASPGMIKALAVYPYRRGNDLLGADNFKVDGLVSLFFTSGDMKFRPGTDSVLKLDTSGSTIALARDCNGVFAASLDQQDFSPGDVNPQSEDASSVTRELTFNTQQAASTIAQKVNNSTFLTIVRQKTMVLDKSVDPPRYVNQGDYQVVAQGQDASTKTVFGIPPLTVDGTEDTDFTDPAKVAGWIANGRDITLRMAVWLRVRNGDGKTVDLVPASMLDDKTANGQNDNNNHSMGPEGAVQLGVNNPLMRFTGAKVTVSQSALASAAPAPFALTPTAVMCPDPRWNWAPEHWFSCNDATASVWLQNCGRGRDDGCDRDIFMATSDAGYMQSVYELAFIPRVTDSSGDRLTSNGLFGNVATPDDGRTDWATALNGVRNNGLMWVTYRPYQRGSFARDPLEEIGLLTEGHGFKINPYSDETNVVMTAFANTPVDWWAAADAADSDVGVPSSDRKNADNFNRKYAFSEKNSQARFSRQDLLSVAGAFIGRFHIASTYKQGTETDVDVWEDVWDGVSGDGLTWNENSDYFLGVPLSDSTDDLFDVDRKFLYGYWRECFSPQQQLFLVFVRAEPMMMGGGTVRQSPPQLGARAVALVWRDPYARSGSGKPHRTRVLFYRQFD